MFKSVSDQVAVAVNKAQLWDMTATDSLTGLYVRRCFMIKLQEEIHRAERYNKKLSVIMADLDKFKDIYDTYGHDVGDRALQASVGICRKMFAKWKPLQDMVAKNSLSLYQMRMKERHIF